MSLDAWLTVAITGLVLLGLALEMAPPDLLFLGGTVLLAVFGVLQPGEAVAGFANPGVITVGALFAVAAALRETGVMEHIGNRLLGRSTSERSGLMRLAALVMPMSAVINNTPIVALMTPVVLDWCRKREVSPSRLLMPLSFLTILGGTCTLIGTSTNLVVQGLMLESDDPRLKGGMGFLEIGYVGLPCAIIGVIYLFTIGRRLLPKRKELMEQLGETRREYLVEMLVQPSCRLIGQTIEAAGLRQLPGLFLIEIDREGTAIGPVSPDEVVRTNDRLVFTGVVSTIVDLEKIPGLVPAADTRYEVSPVRRRGRQLCEAVISPTSPLVGKDVRNADFRALYGAAVVAVHRNGARLPTKVGDVVLRPGDTLLLQVGPHFTRAYRNSPDFYLVSTVAGSRPLRHEKAGIAVAIFVVLVAAMATGLLNTMLAALLAAGLMVAFRCLSVAQARDSVEWPILVTIAASFGVGAALEKAGVAEAAARFMIGSTGSLHPIAVLSIIYLATMILNELITNNAAAALAFPFAIEAAHTLGSDPRPFAIAVALAASHAYASPIGYQTHMMVYGPGGYRFGDFVRVGLPLNLLLWVMATVIIPLWWPL